MAGRDTASPPCRRVAVLIAAASALAGCFSTDPGPLRVRWDGWEIGPLGNATVRLHVENVGDVGTYRFDSASTGWLVPGDGNESREVRVEVTDLDGNVISAIREPLPSDLRLAPGESVPLVHRLETPYAREGDAFAYSIDLGYYVGQEWYFLRFEAPCAFASNGTIASRDVINDYALRCDSVDQGRVGAIR